MDVIADFFAAIPDVVVALWEFGDGFFGLAVMLGSVALFAGFCLLAWQLRERQGWLSALFGTMAALVASWWLLGIIPSAWVYFADAERELLEGTIIPAAIVVGQLDVASNFYNVFRDSVVMLQGAIVTVAIFWFALAWQKRFPTSLAEGEERGPTTGGYK